MIYNDAISNGMSNGVPKLSFGVLDDGAETEVIARRAEALERNNTIARSVLDRSVENLIGTGIKLRATTSSPEFNKAVMKRWKFYQMGNRLDVRRMMSFDGLQIAGARDMLRGGDCGYAMLKIRGRPQLQFIENSMIAQPPYADANVIDGIEWGDVGQPIAFYIRTYDVHGVVEYVRVTARDFIYLCDHPRASAGRGLSRFCGSFSMFNNFAGFIDAVVKTARVQNAQAIMAKSKSPKKSLEGRAGNQTTTDADTNQFRTIPIEGGSVNFVPDAEEWIAFQPTAPGANIDTAVSTLGRFLGLAFGMAYDDVFLDFSNASYSNSRMRRLALNVTVAVFQQYFKTAFFDRFWPWFVSCEVKNGGITVPAPEDAWEYEWIPNARPSVDQLVEARALEILLRNFLETHQNAVEASGYDWKTFLETLLRNREELPAMESATSTNPKPKGKGASKSEDPEDPDESDTPSSGSGKKKPAGKARRK